VPLKILQRNEYKAFPHNHKNIRILRFPDEDNKFGQCVVLATRMYGKTESEEKNWQEQLENPMSLHDRPAHLYKVPAVTLPEDLPKKFYSDFLTQEDLGKLAAHRMVRAAHEIDVRLSDNRLKPLMPLRIGHQALVLATGAFDGVYKAPDTGNTLVLFGNTERAETSVETDEGDGTGKRVVRSAPRSQVIAWDMTESAELGEPVLYKYV
jgi:hypothetical protein